MPDRMPQRILHLISTLDTGGAEQNLARLVTRMDRLAFENMVVSMTTIGPVGQDIHRQGISVAALGMRKGLPDPVGLVRLKQIIQDFRPDIIQTWMYHANLLGCLFSCGTPLIWNLRCSDMDVSRYGLVYRSTVRLGAWCARIPDAVIANSYAGESFHAGIGYRPKRWEVIPNGFDMTRFHPDSEACAEVRRELDIPRNAIVIGLIARLDPMKDHATFFRAAQRLQTSYPDVHFVLAGRGVELSNPDIRAIMRVSPKLEHVHLLGERRDITRLLAAIDIVSCSSAYGEGTPTSIGEALATGIPCVVTAVGDAPLLVGEAGLVVPPRTPLLLAQAWEQLIQAGPEQRAYLGRTARERIRSQYSLEAMVGQYEHLYSAMKKDYVAESRGSSCRR